jgi:hypothetical protein
MTSVCIHHIASAMFTKVEHKVTMVTHVLTCLKGVFSSFFDLELKTLSMASDVLSVSLSIYVVIIFGVVNTKSKWFDNFMCSVFVSHN